MNKPEVLIISNTLDFGTDYITHSLELRGVKYLRINRDRFKNYLITFDIVSGVLTIEVEGEKNVISEGSLKSIYYRAPVFLRDNYQPELSPTDQLYRTQWTAFIKNLVFFENVLWVNNPAKTYRAENKMLQLKIAKRLGLRIPETIVTNNSENFKNNDVPLVMKSIDTALFRKEGKEAFVYTNVVLESDLMESDLSDLPVVIQKFLEPKMDVRVTIVGSKIFSVKILKDENGIKGDWRKHKDGVVFEPFILPKHIEYALLQLNQQLGLNYSAVDLAIFDNEYYFIEINPTGEWAWLVDNANLRIDKSICDLLEVGSA